MSLLPPRSLFTDALVEHLEEQLDAPVGDGRRPAEAGWPQQAGQGLFVASVVVETLEGREGSRRSIDAQTPVDWLLQYRLSTVGGLRKQADDLADAVRAAVLTLPHGSTDPLKIDRWRVQTIDIPNQAPVVKEGGPTEEWPTFRVDDVVVLSLARSRS